MICFKSLGQQNVSANVAPLPPPLAVRQVSGLVKDSTGNVIPGVTVKLISKKDSILTSTDQDGIFIFENIKSAVFTLTVSGLGYTSLIRKYYNNDLAEKLVLAPITINEKSYQIKQVVVDGKPTIIYKTDTVEYKASDYKIREYDRVDKLLKKMEGMEVNKDGSLSYQGQTVTKAKLNGREFAGGSVRQVIQNLPASIVDKIQILDDYGDLAAKTGIKNGDPSKTLNITTKSDKSIGTIGQFRSQYGNNDRYNENLSVQRINANKVISFIGDFNRTINGVSSSGSSSPGVTKSGAPVLSYTDNWGSKLTFNGSYNYSFDNTLSDIQSYGYRNSTIGPSSFKSHETSSNRSATHTLRSKLEYQIDKTDYLQITPTFSVGNSDVNNSSLQDNLNFFTRGFEHPVLNMTTTNPTKKYIYGFNTIFVHIFKNPSRNFSLQIGWNRSKNTISGNKLADYRYFNDTTQNFLIKDSLSNLLTFKTNSSNTIQSIITYAEPISTVSRIEFIGQFKRIYNDNHAVSDSILSSGRLIELTRLSNIFNFSFTEFRGSLSYSFNGKDNKLTLGFAIVPTTLSGTQIDNNNGNTAATTQSFFRVIPVLKANHSWTQTENFQITYSGNYSEPNFQQLQPFVDRSDPNNLIVGNPNLRPVFTHSLSAGYNTYFANSKFNFSLNIASAFASNDITTNIVQITVPISPTLNNTINEIHFVNVGGNKAFRGNYSLSKRFNDNQYNFSFNGGISYNIRNAMSNYTIYNTSIWDFNQRVGSNLSFANDNIEVNPFVGYELNKSSSSTSNYSPVTIQTTKLAINGRYNPSENFEIHYEASKNFLSGYSNYNLNPLVINLGCEIRLLRNRPLAVTADVFDLLHQNNFIQQIVTPQSTTYLRSNPLSRFFMIGLKLNFQRWGGTPQRDGKKLKRRGDGSFIY